MVVNKKTALLSIVGISALSSGCTQEVQQEDLSVSITNVEVLARDGGRYRGQCSFDVVLKNGTKKSMTLCLHSEHFSLRAFGDGANIDLYDSSEPTPHDGSLRRIGPGESIRVPQTVSWLTVEDVGAELSLRAEYLCFLERGWFADHKRSWSGQVVSQLCTIRTDVPELRRTVPEKPITVLIQAEDEARSLRKVELTLPSAFTQGNASGTIALAGSTVSMGLVTETAEEKARSLREATIKLTAGGSDSEWLIWRRSIRINGEWIGIREVKEKRATRESVITYSVWKDNLRLNVQISSKAEAHTVSDSIHRLVQELSRSLVAE